MIGSLSYVQTEDLEIGPNHNELIGRCGRRLVTPNMLSGLSRTKTETSPKFYGISVLLLREIIVHCGDCPLPSRGVINTCLFLGMCPDSLKIARVDPVYKIS